MSSAARPLLFLDVDGPLIPFGGSHPVSTGGNPLLGRIDPALGPRLAALPCDLVWATTWMNDANEVIAPLLGLPPLPVLDGPDSDGPEHWKTRLLVAMAGGRPFVWVDDEISPADRTWVAAHHEGPALLHRVDPAHGLTDTDFAAITAWLMPR